MLPQSKIMNGETESKSENDTVSDAWDFKGRPAERSRTGGWSCVALIIGVELCERLTTLGVAVNLVTYITDTMHLGNSVAANTVTNFLGTSFMLCLLGGFIADTYLGRYLTVAIFTGIQATGMTILAMSTKVRGLQPPSCANNSNCVPANGMQMGILYTALYLTALGTGGLKSSLSGFGSDQFDESDPVEKKHMHKFFNWFIFFITFGSLLSVTILVYIQDNKGRVWGYGICALAIVLVLLMFLAGTTKYRFKKITGSPLTQIATVVTAAWRKRNDELPSDSSLLYDDDKLDGKGKQRLPHTNQFRFLDHAAIVNSSPEQQTKWELCTVTDIEEVKMVICMLPIWATTILFWTIYAQMSTFFVSQATKMDRNIGSFQIPSGSLTAFFVISILVTVPFFDGVITPLCHRITKHPQGTSPLQQIAIGLALSVVAMVLAALIELLRLHKVHSNAPQMSVFWLVPQFFFVGAGEAICYMGQLSFFLTECPKGMKTMSTGMFLSTMSLGCFFSSVIVTIVHKITGDTGPGAWLPDDIDKGKVYDLYWLLAVLSLINLGAFVISAKKYVYKDSKVPLEVEMNETCSA